MDYYYYVFIPSACRFTSNGLGQRQFNGTFLKLFGTLVKQQ